MYPWKILIFGLLLSTSLLLIIDVVDAYAKQKLIYFYPLGPLPVAEVPREIEFGPKPLRWLIRFTDWATPVERFRLLPRPNITPLFTLLPSYDFIIIGSGAGAAAAASRLRARLPKSTILMLEAGGYAIDGLLSPELLPAAALLNQGAEADWAHLTETSPEVELLSGMHERRLRWPMGKGLGGSTALNFMISHHGLPSDWDLWALCLDDASWNYSSVSRDFASLESRNEFTPGRIPVDSTGGHSAFGERIVSAAVAAGFLPDSDYLAPSPLPADSPGSVAELHLNRHQGRRVSAYRSLIAPLLEQQKDSRSEGGAFHVLPYAHVTEILWKPVDGKGKPHGSDGVEATAVQFVLRPPAVQHERFDRLAKQTVPLKKEVVLGAGAIGSAKILLQSGIGPADELTEVLKNRTQFFPLPAVGRHLQDHSYSPVPMRLHDSFADAVLSRKNARLARNVWNLLRGRGLLTSPGANTQVLVANLKNAVPDKRMPEFCRGVSSVLVDKLLAETPDLQILFYEAFPSLADLSSLMNVNIEGNVPLLGDLADDWGVSPAEQEQYRRGEKSVHEILTDWRKPYMLSVPVVLHPQSLGSVSLRSNDPLDPPVIDPAYLVHPRDVKVMSHGRRTVERIALRAPDLFAKVLRNTCPACHDLRRVPQEVLSACCNEEGGSDNEDFFEARLVMTLYHPAGTCRMGREGDPLACSNSRLQVRGTRNIRVADASAIPELPSGNTALPTAVIGWKAADFIADRWL